MTFCIELQPRAEREIGQGYLWLGKRSPHRAARWLIGLHRALASLAMHPTRCSLAPEADVFEEEIRQLLYGKKPNVWRILFVIRAPTVLILCVRHASRPFLGLGELDLSDLT